MEGSPRSAGVTVSAGVVLIGSALTVLFGAITVLGSLAISHSPAGAGAPVNVGAILLMESTLFFGFGGWGLATGVGLIGTRPWARISLLVYAGILLFAGLIGALVIAFAALPHPPDLYVHDQQLPTNFLLMMRVGISLFYGSAAAIGAFWLYFFNKQSVKAQFGGKQLVIAWAAPDSPSGIPTAAPGEALPTRPLSITIIGWFLIIGSLMVPPILLFDHALMPSTQLPFFFLGFFFSGGSGFVILVAWMAVQLVAAVGLLQLRNWGRLWTIGLQGMAILNCALLVGIPGNRTRFQQLMEAMTASMNARSAYPRSFVFPMWIGFAASLPFVVVILWFLYAERGAFRSNDSNIGGQ
jgi:hypothetical protein